MSRDDYREAKARDRARKAARKRCKADRHNVEDQDGKRWTMNGPDAVCIG